MLDAVESETKTGLVAETEDGQGGEGSGDPEMVGEPKRSEGSPGGQLNSRGDDPEEAWFAGGVHQVGA